MKRALIITGTRDPNDLCAESIRVIEYEIMRCHVLLVGDARGVDEEALTFARSIRGDRSWLERVEVFNADWERHGKAAGPKRNEAMVYRATALRGEGCDVRMLAVPGPKSIGTWDCLRRAVDRGIPAIVRPAMGRYR